MSSAATRLVSIAPGADAPAPPRSGGLGVEASGGLVSYKTTQSFSNQTVIGFGAPQVAERRIKRLKRSVWASGHWHALADHGFRAPQAWFVTLTYAEADAWSPEHMTKACSYYRNWCKSVGVPCRYTWVAEIQPKRLARTGKAVVHYHLLAWLPHGVVMPQWDKPKGRRRDFWPHGMTNTQKSTASVGYLMKYLSKLGELTIFPKGLRLYGVGGLDASGRAIRAWHNLPEWAKRYYGVGEVVRRSYGLMVKATGEILESPYKVLHCPGGLVLEQVRDIVDRWHAGPYSTFPRAI